MRTLALALLAGPFVLSPLMPQRTSAPTPAPATPAGASPIALGRCDPRTRIASLPFVITSPGSYVVTRNLTATGATDGITIACSNVSIDLLGFTLDGQDVGLRGIVAPGGVKSISVVNGTLRHWVTAGIDAVASEEGLFEDLHFEQNGIPGGVGMALGFNSIAHHCTLESNGAIGLRAYTNCLVTDCTVGNTNGIGISIDARTVVRGCIVMRSQGTGIVGSGLSTIAGNTVFENLADGIALPFVGGGNTVIQDNNVYANAGAGIRVDPAIPQPVGVVRNQVFQCSPNYAVPAMPGFGPVGIASTASSPWANLSY